MKSNSNKNYIYIGTIVIALLLVIPVSYLGGQPVSVAIGNIIEAKNDVTIRNEPPKQKFFVLIEAPGEVITTMDKGAVFIVTDVQTVNVPFRQDIWVKISSEDPAFDTLGGWVYFGTAEKTINFTVESTQ